jgi:hypothetical protein
MEAGGILGGGGGVAGNDLVEQAGGVAEVPGEDLAENARKSVRLARYRPLRLLKMSPGFQVRHRSCRCRL